MTRAAFAAARRGSLGVGLGSLFLYSRGYALVYFDVMDVIAHTDGYAFLRTFITPTKCVDLCA